jgi:hypothetical protein
MSLKNKPFIPFPFFTKEWKGKSYIYKIEDKDYKALDTDSPTPAELLAHYEKFKHVRVCKYLTIDRKIRTKKSTAYILSLGGKEIELTSSDASKPQKLAEILSQYDDLVNPKKANAISDYLVAYNEHNYIKPLKGVMRTGWNNKNFFLPNRSIDGTVFISNEDNLTLRYSQKGDLKHSLELIRAMSHKKAFMPFMGVLSSPLYGVIDAMKTFNHVTHLSSSSGRGKTLSVQMALSLVGDPNEYKSNFSQTLVGAEMYFAENYDMACFIDETESAKKVDDVIGTFYMFSNRHGKNRGAMSGNDVVTRDTVSFRGHLITTGEKNVDSLLDQSLSQNIKNGVIRRVVDYPIGNDYFGDEYNHSEVMSLKQKAFSNYGLFIDEWVDIISKNRDKLNEDFYKITSEINKNLADKELVYYAFILVLKLLHDNGFIDKRAYLYQYKMLLNMLEVEVKKRENVKYPHLAFMDKFREYIIINKSNFGETTFKDNVKQFGEYLDNGNLAILKTPLNQIIKESGYSPREIKTSLEKDGILFERSSTVAGHSSSIKHWEIVVKEKHYKEIVKELTESGNLIYDNEETNHQKAVS